MIFLILTIIVFYILVVLYFVRRHMRNIQHGLKKEFQSVERQLEKIKEKHKALHKEKLNLEENALEIFTLYEITKDIALSTSDDDAFKIFREKLAEHVSFLECLFFGPFDKNFNKIQEDKDFFIFVLRGKRRKIGSLAIKGLKEEDKEKFMILCHQFGMALRRVKLYEEIEQIAITDSLTELNTRRYSMERFAEELKRAKTRKTSLSFLMIDVDFFKKINDKYGHLTGDQVLREVGFIIKENIREIDIAGRYGGEEFCVILPETDRSGGCYAAERIRKATEDAIIKAYDTKLKVSLSIGISTFPDDGAVMSELMDKSDWALYRAKKQGRNRICCFGDYKEEV